MQGHDGHRERLRERYQVSGLDGFAEHEALELLLTYAIPRKNTNDVAHELFRRFGTLQSVLNAHIAELMTVEGIGERTAVFLHMQGELVRYLTVNANIRERLRIATPAIAARFALTLMQGERYENVYVVSLDKNNRLLHSEKLVTGTLSEAPLYPRRVVETALQHGAHSVLLLHNHPSGDPTPSDSDISATLAVKQALNSISIELYDHLVVGHEYVYSYARKIYIDREGNVFERIKGLRGDDTGVRAEQVQKAAEKPL